VGNDKIGGHQKSLQGIKSHSVSQAKQNIVKNYYNNKTLISPFLLAMINNNK